MVENRGLPGNGLTDSVSPEEGEPLRSKRGKKPRKEQISMGTPKKVAMKEPEVDSDDEEPGSSSRGGRNRLEACARKCQLTPKRALIYLLFSFALIFLLLMILIIMVALWPSSPSQDMCQTAQCHAYSATLLQSMNASARPCEDVWEFSCGGWLHNHPIPESRAYWDANLNQQLEGKHSGHYLFV